MKLLNLLTITGVVLSAGISAEARTFNFSEAEEFKTGLLDGQNDWVSELNTVVSTGNGYITLAEEPWKAGYYAHPISADAAKTYTLSATFSFSVAADQGNNDIFSFIFNDRMSNKGTARCFLTRASGGGYKIGFKGLKTQQSNSDLFPAESIGLAAGKQESDLLKLTFSLTKGAHSNDWKLELELENLSSKKTVTSLTKTGIETTQELFDATELYGGFSSSRTEEVSGTTNRRIHSIEIKDHAPKAETLSLLLN